MKILTGNELLSGAAVYLDAGGRWGGEVQRARVFGAEDGDALEAAMGASVASGRIISIEPETIEMRDGAIYPLRIRERIRAEGPSAPRLNRQTLAEDDHVSI